MNDDPEYGSKKCLIDSVNEHNNAIYAKILANPNDPELTRELWNSYLSFKVKIINTRGQTVLEENVGRHSVKSSVDMLSRLSQMVGWTTDIIIQIIRSDTDKVVLEETVILPREKTKAELDDSTLSWMLGTRECNALKNAGIPITVNSLSEMTEKQLMDIPGMGKKGLLIIKEAIGNMGRTFSG